MSFCTFNTESLGKLIYIVTFNILNTFKKAIAILVQEKILE